MFTNEDIKKLAQNELNLDLSDVEIISAQNVTAIKKDGKIDEAKHKDERSKEKFCPKCGMRYPDRNRKICPRCMEKGKLFRRFSVFLMRSIRC
mgnify:CR=1 FL=1